MHILVTRSGTNSNRSTDNIGILWNRYLFNSKLCKKIMGRDNYLKII